MTTHKFTLYAGATFNETVLYRDESGNAIDLTGYDATLRVRDILTKAIVAEFSTSNDNLDPNYIEVTPASGQIRIVGKPGYTEDLVQGDYEYSLEIGMEDTSDVTERTRILEGDFEIRERIVATP